MAIRKLVITGLLLFPWLSWSAQSIYCPQNSGYINVGMTQDQVISACGQPTSRQESNQPVYQKVPVKQLFFNHQGSSKAFYGVWALPGGNSNPEKNMQPFDSKNSGGEELQINVINDKVSSVILNGNNTNAFSICNGRSVEVGNSVNDVYSACGSPTLVNATYINVPIPSANKPQIWIYQMGNYQSPISLTFIDGKLQSIQ